jgi:Rieske 2Fe-2S family protein
MDIFSSMDKRTARGAQTLSGAYFTSTDIFELEWERIFLQRWLCIGRVDRLAQPGNFFVEEIGSENIIVLCDQDGVLRAFYDVCRHRGSRLCTERKGRFSHTIQCPYHAWTYGLDGRLLGAPNMQGGDGFEKVDYPLFPVAIAEWEGFLFLNLAPDPQSFHQAYAPLLGKFQQWHLPDLAVAHRIKYLVQANWKLLFQNYSECYHCPTLHPALNLLTPFEDSCNDLEEGPFLGGPMRLAQEGGSMTLSGRACAPPLGDVSGDDLQLVYYYTLFPSMFLSLHAEYVLTHRLEPIAPDCTRVICEWLFAPQDIARPDFDPTDAVDFWNITNEQDWHICELSQRGVSSRAYVPGPYAGLESIAAAFDHEYLTALGKV